MNDTIDYKQAFERQKLAYERSELLLEDRTRELSDANATLTSAIEELKNHELAMVQKEKLASIGLLAAGIAHEINSPVGFVKNNLEILKAHYASIRLVLSAYESLLAKLDKNKLRSEFVEEIEAIHRLIDDHEVEYIIEDTMNSIEESLSGTNRIQNIVSDLKGYSRNDGNERVKIDLNECIDTALNLVWNEIKYKCEIKRDYSDLPPLFGCASQLAQVFINIIQNSAQAISSKGVIEIRTRRDEDNVIAEFIDNGPGIPEADLIRLFDPFFTTKEVGMGTGLGLYVSHGLIQSHKGTIAAENEPGMGAKLTVTLPVDMRGEGVRQ